MKKQKRKRGLVIELKTFDQKSNSYSRINHVSNYSFYVVEDALIQCFEILSLLTDYNIILSNLLAGKNIFKNK